MIPNVALNWDLRIERPISQVNASKAEILICTHCQVPERCDETDPRCGLRKVPKAELRPGFKRTKDELEIDKALVLSAIQSLVETQALPPIREQIQAALRSAGHDMTSKHLDLTVAALRKEGAIRKVGHWRWEIAGATPP